MTQVYKVQLSMNQRHLVDSGLTFKQGDFGFQIEIEVLDFDVTGVTPQIIFRKSSGAVESTSITTSGNKFTYTMAGTELDIPGPAICDLKLKNSTTQRISTASFRYYVEADTMDGLHQQANSYSGTIEQIIDGYDEELDSVENYAVKPDYSTSTAVTDIEGIINISGGAYAAHYNNGIAMVDNSNYNAYYLIAPKELKVFVDPSVTVDVAMLGVGTNYLGIEEHSSYDILLCTSNTVYRTSDSNLPTTEENAVTIPRGGILAVTWSGSATLKLFGITDYKTMGDPLKEDIQDMIDSSVEEIEDYALKDIPKSIKVSDIPGIISSPGHYAGHSNSAISMYANASYTGYYLLPTEEVTVYIDPASSGVSVCMLGVGTGYTGIGEHSTYYDLFCSSNTVYRTLDGNLPTTPETAVTVPAGGILAVTGSGAGEPKIFGFATQKSMGDPLTADVQAMIDASVDNQKVLIQYVSGSGGDSSTEYVNVYTPAVNGYIRYRLVHTDDSTINADVWRIRDAYYVNLQLTEVTQLTTAGEWELAVHLPDRDDFSGGYAHGDEVLAQDASFYINGQPVDITDYTDVTEVKYFSVIEQTNLYDPADHTTVIAKHGSEHLFNKDGLKISQTVFWLITTSLTNCYLAMLPIAKAVTDHYYTDKTYVATEIGTSSHTEVKAYKSRIYGEDSGVSCEFSVPRYPDIAYFFMTDNGGSLYNKCYFAINTSSGVASSDFWKTETVYKFDINT